MTATHATARPWRQMPANPKYIEETDRDGRWGLIVADCSMTDEGAANAALIVAAVNAYSPESGAVFQELVGALEAHELWEADLILNGDWSGTTLRLTQDQHDKLTAVQIRRNAALRRARAISPPPAADEDKTGEST